MNLEEQIERLNEVVDIVGGEIRDDYSGRGMYGRRCTASSAMNPSPVLNRLQILESWEPITTRWDCNILSTDRIFGILIDLICIE
jgi:hypothetical protein